jgi:hypothetical protein
MTHSLNSLVFPDKLLVNTLEVQNNNKMLYNREADSWQPFVMFLCPVTGDWIVDFLL